MLNIKNNIKVVLKKFTQYWKNIKFRYSLGKLFSKRLLFLLKELFLKKYLETENLYNINIDIISKINKKLYIVLEK